MKTIINRIWEIGWRLLLCLSSIALIIIAILASASYYEHRNRYYTDKHLSENIASHYFYNREEEQIYNYTTGRYTLNEVQWVVDAPAKDSLTVFCRKGKRGYLNVNTGEPVIAEQYRRAWIFSEGVAAVMKNGKIGFINSRNEIVLPFEYDYADRNGMAIDYLFRSGYCTMTNANGACGLIDKTGRWVIEAQYDCIWPPHEGMYRIVKDGDKYGLLNDKLEFIFPLEYDYIEYSDEKGVCLNKDGYKWQADYDGTIIKPFICDEIDYINYPSGYNNTLQNSYDDEEPGNEQLYTLSNYLIYRIYNKCGIVQKSNGKVIIPALYKQIDMVSPTLFKAQNGKSKEWIFIDIHGKIVENKR